ncbi:MAG: HEPN domain-containing protein [Ignavibacteriales bacterium]|nr:MAG: HEPN domain-containing protein [Ignavibacteriales bacterium]
MNEKINYWSDLANYDLKTARIMLETKRYLYVGFMCHQVIEKVLKAYYWYKLKKEPPYTHNLITLAIQSGLSEKLKQEQIDHINLLLPLNIQARYPKDKTELSKTLNKKRCKIIFDNTADLYKWINKLLKI